MRRRVEVESLLADIERIEGCEFTKRKVREVLRSYSGRRIYISGRAIMRPVVLSLARRLVSHLPQDEAAAALMARAGVARATAYRILKEAKTSAQMDLFGP